MIGVSILSSPREIVRSFGRCDSEDGAGEPGQTLIHLTSEASESRTSSASSCHSMFTRQNTSGYRFGRQRSAD